MDRKRRRTNPDSHPDCDCNTDRDAFSHTDRYPCRDAAAYADAQESSHTEAAPNCFSSSIRLRRSSFNTGVLAEIPL